MYSNLFMKRVLEGILGMEHGNSIQGERGEKDIS